MNKKLRKNDDFEKDDFEKDLNGNHNKLETNQVSEPNHHTKTFF